MNRKSLAAQMLQARDSVQIIARPSRSDTTFDLKAAYEQAAVLTAMLTARGWCPVGRKLGFTNRATWHEFDLSTPIWAPIYDRSVTRTSIASHTFSLAACVAPRIEPEIVLGLNAHINDENADMQSLSAAVDWIAPGFEIVDCHYANWDFNAADIVADFGAHAHLVIGEKTQLHAKSRLRLAETLSAASVVLECNKTVIDRGVGANALDGPLAALANLQATLAQQENARPLGSKEIITTGTLTRIPFIAPGETWTATFTGTGLADLTIKLV